MELNRDYEEMLKSLNEYRVRYLLIGAYAVMYYTEPRYTKDMDIWVERSEGNIKKLYKALRNFGAPLTDISINDFMDPHMMYQIGIEPVRVNIMSDLFGIDFKKEWNNRVVSKYGSERVNIIDIKSLIMSKRKANRKQDEIDIEKLLIAKKTEKEARHEQ